MASDGGASSDPNQLGILMAALRAYPTRIPKIEATSKIPRMTPTARSMIR